MKEKILEISNWYDTLSADSVKKIKTFYANETYFRDPFNEFHHIEPLTKLYDDMFKKITNPKFKITKTFIEGHEAVLFWDFTFKAMNKDMLIKGNTLLKLNDELKITYHYDYWDSVNELWIKTPVIGSAIKLFYKMVF